MLIQEPCVGMKVSVVPGRATLIVHVTTVVAATTVEAEAIVLASKTEPQEVRRLQWRGSAIR